VLKQPLGVVGLITAWNFPAWNIARAGGAALAAGCTIVIRPSEYTPRSGMAVARLLTEAGAPAGVVNLVNGDPGPMGQAMLASPAVAKIHFTGSTRVGKLLMDGASKTVTRLSLELGGNAPVLIFPDVDLDAVVTGATAAKFRNGGQVCVSPQRFLISKDAAPEFTERMAAAAGALRLGDGLDPRTQVGPLINATQRDRVEALVAGARDGGARVAVGGARPADRPTGFFYQPTVVADLTPDAPLYREEIFGPVLPVSTFDGVDEAIAIANSTRYGLAAYVWTNHLPTALHVAERLEFGLVGVNEWTPQSTEAPFVGWKESGLGRESGAEGLEEYLETKLIAIGGVPR
jgi:acyl-CoA reductase-like NAD-dependent aldehyde dehydrogenase